MPKAKVIGPLKLDGIDVPLGRVVEIAGAAFSNLLRKGRIVPADDSPEVEVQEPAIEIPEDSITTSKRSRKKDA